MKKLNFAALEWLKNRCLEEEAKAKEAYRKLDNTFWFMFSKREKLRREIQLCLGKVTIIGEIFKEVKLL